MKTSHSFRKKLLSASVASVLGLAASGPLSADTYELSFVGAFTMINGSGYAVRNSPSPYKCDKVANPNCSGVNDPYAWGGYRTPITGTMAYNTDTGTGSLTIAGFLFFGQNIVNNTAQAHDITVSAIGNGTCTNNDPAQGCGAGNLFLGNMLFDWNSHVYPVTSVWDAQGFLGALSAAVPGTVIQAVGALPASNGLDFDGLTFLLGAAPLAVTTSNTTNNPACPIDPLVDGGRLQCASGVPSGILPLISDTIPGAPIVGTSFDGFSPNFDIRKMTVTKKNGVSAVPLLQTKAPASGATNVVVGATVTLSFTNSMDAASVNSAFSLKDASNATVTGTLLPNTGNATNFTFTPAASLSYSTTYTATVTGAALDVANQPLSGAPVVWSFTTAAPPVVATCTPDAQVPVGGNFTMLNGDGSQVGGTNDIAYSFTFDPDNIQAGDLNTSESDYIPNMTLASTTPQPFFGHTWTAHHIRVFGPGTWTFDTTCTVAQIEAGTSDCGNSLGTGQTQRYLTMTVGDGQLGAHMLFDWNKASNIDVVNVWSRNAAWNTGPSDMNLMFTGVAWSGPAGVTVNPNTTWNFVSTDPEGDDVNGMQMVDGSFISFNANFNLGASDSCLASAAKPISVSTVGSSSSTGCSISTKPSSITVFERSDWLFVGGFLAWLGALRFRTRRSSKA